MIRHLRPDELTLYEHPSLGIVFKRPDGTLISSTEALQIIEKIRKAYDYEHIGLFIEQYNLESKLWEAGFNFRKNGPYYRNGRPVYEWRTFGKDSSWIKCDHCGTVVTVDDEGYFFSNRMAISIDLLANETTFWQTVYCRV